MENPLVTHAKHTIWCATNQDFQYHINLARITPNGGILTSYPVLWDHLAVPKVNNKKAYFHYYQIGNLPEKKFDLIVGENIWTNYLDLNIADNLLVDVYMISGAMIPRDHIWLTRLYNNNIIIAIQCNFTINYGVCNKTYFNGVVYNDRFTLDNESLIIRFYSNAYFGKIDYIKNAVDPKQPIRHVYKYIKTQNDYIDYIKNVRSIENEFNDSGNGIYYIDGFIVNDILGFTPDMLGRHLGFTWDESSYRERWFDVKYLPTFTSVKHRGVRKYLIVTNDVYENIDYHDDVDIYIVNKITGKGVYYNRNTDFGLSMITHNAYSIDAGVVEQYIELHDFLGSVDNCKLRVMIRKGGRTIGMFNQKNRIEELYKLDYEGTLNALINTQSLVPEWTARGLENSAYVTLMSANSQDVNSDMVIDAYGYNGILSSFFGPQVLVRDDEFRLPLPLLKPDNDTDDGVRSVFCYNSDGKLLSYFQNKSLSSTIRVPSNLKNVAFSECFNLSFPNQGEGIWVNQNVSSNEIEQYGFRCYLSSGNLNGILGDWDDVTGTSFYTYTAATKTEPASIFWNWQLLNDVDLYPAVKSNKHMRIHRWTKTEDEVYDGCIEIVCKDYQRWGNAIEYRPLDLPAGNVDVFANGLSLVEDIDYVMKWPTIIINNKQINSSNVINIIVRSYGFGSPLTNDTIKSKDTGFIKNGMVSIDGIYGVRDSKAIRMVVENKLVNPANFNYGEYLKGNYYTDGKPYSITDYVIPIENFLVGKNTWELYSETLDIDNRVSDYLTPRIAEITAPNPIVNVTRWPVISPVVSSILYSFLNGYDFDSIVPDNYSNEDIEKWLKPFKWLLDYDPAYLNVDENYFRIEPHANDNVIIISQKQYEFLGCIIKMYLNNRVDISVNVRIGE